MTSNNRNNNNEVNNIVFNSIIEVVNNHPEQVWMGTMTQLQNAVRKISNKTNQQQLPKSPISLRLVINQIINRIRNRGVSVKFTRATDSKRTRFIKLTNNAR